MNPKNRSIFVVLSWLLGIAFFCVPGCIKPTPDDKVRAQLAEQIETLEAELSQYKEKLQKAPDAGAINELINERDLLKSRVERLKAKLAASTPGGAPPTGGGH